MASIRQKLDGILNPNALINRTVWSTPQEVGHRMECCLFCKYYVVGKCSDLRVMAAYGKAPTMHNYYTCSYFKEKEDGSS